MRTSVIIPTHRPESPTLRRCLASLTAQTMPPAEVIVSVDGAEGVPAPDAPQGGDAIGFRVIRAPHSGPAAARNRALAHATGDLLLFLNDDVVAAPDLVERHAADRTPGDGLVLGSAPWAMPAEPSLLDALLEHTPLVFFYCEMHGIDAREPAKDWGYRHAWTLNLSLHREACAPFDERLRQPMFDDLEWAYRVTRSLGVPVRYRPGAGVTHHHRYAPEGVLAREVVLGHQAAGLERLAPGCAHETLGAALGRWRGAVDERAVVEAGRAFAVFSDEAQRPLRSLPSGRQSPAGLREFLGSCRPWRETARHIGYRDALEGRTPAESTAGVATRFGVPGPVM